MSAIKVLELLQREMLCDEDCEDYHKNCVTRIQLDYPVYRYYKKRKQKKKEA